MAAFHDALLLPLGPAAQALLLAPEESNPEGEIAQERQSSGRCNGTSVAGAHRVGTCVHEYTAPSLEDVEIFESIATTLGTREVSMLNMLLKAGKARGVAVRSLSNAALPGVPPRTSPLFFSRLLRAGLPKHPRT